MNALLISLLTISFEMGDYETTLRLLPKKNLSEQNQFRKVVCLFELRQEKDFKAALADFHWSFAKSGVKRYKNIISLLEDETENRKVPLVDIAAKMKNAARLINLNRPHKEVAARQGEILSDLDKLIAQAEQQKKEQEQKEKEKDSPEGRKQGKAEGKPGNPNGNRSSDPADASNIANGEGAGKVDDRKLASIAKQWGKLPDRERAKALVELTRDMAPRYRQVVEDYFRELSKASERERKPHVVPDNE